MMPQPTQMDEVVMFDARTYVLLEPQADFAAALTIDPQICSRLF
jgi:hypothetical protein